MKGDVVLISGDTLTHYRDGADVVRCRARITDYYGELTDHGETRRVLNREATPIDCELEEHHEGDHKATNAKRDWTLTWDDNDLDTPLSPDVDKVS